MDHYKSPPTTHTKNLHPSTFKEVCLLSVIFFLVTSWLSFMTQILVSQEEKEVAIQLEVCLEETGD